MQSEKVVGADQEGGWKWLEQPTCSTSSQPDTPRKLLHHAIVNKIKHTYSEINSKLKKIQDKLWKIQRRNKNGFKQFMKL